MDRPPGLTRLLHHDARAQRSSRDFRLPLTPRGSAMPRRAIAEVGSSTPHARRPPLDLNPAALSAAPEPHAPTRSPQAETPAAAISAHFFDIMPSRSFGGIFRAMAPVVVHTPASASSHQPNPTAAAAKLPEDSAAGAVSDAQGSAAGEGEQNTVMDLDGEPDAKPQHSATLSDDVKIRKRSASVSSSVVSGGIRHPRRASSSAANSPSVAALSVRRNRRSNSTGGAGRASTQHGSSSIARMGRSASAAAGRHDTAAASTKRKSLKLHMPTVFDGNLHTTLWLATSDGSVEVRSMAEPDTVLSVVPKRTLRTIVTSLRQVGEDRVAAGQSDGSLRLFDAYTLEELRLERAHSAAITEMCVVMMPTAADDATAYPRAAVLLTASLDWSIAKWDGVSLACLGRLHGSHIGVSALAGAVNGCYAYSGGEDGTLRMWNLLDNSHMELTRDEKQILVASYDAGRGSAVALRPQPRLKGTLVPSSDSSSEEDRPQVPPTPHRQLFGSSSSGAAAFAARPISLKKGGRGRVGSASQSLRESPARSRSVPVHSNSTGVKKKKKSSKKKAAVTDATAVLDRVESYLSGHRLCCRRYALGYRALVSLPPRPQGPADGPRFCWPIDTAHREAVTGLAVVEDRLLISASKDTTAKVFALPSGHFVRTLVCPRRVALTGVMLDVQQQRVLVGGSDGSIVGFDLTLADMPIVLQTRSPTMVFAALFFPMRAYTMRRFLLPASYARRDTATSSSPNALVASSSVLVMDRTAQAHGVGKHSLPYHVGDISVRETTQAIRLSELQSQLVASRAEVEESKKRGVDDCVKLKNVRVCARTMQRAHAFSIRSRFYCRWLRLVAKRRLLPKRLERADYMASLQREALIRRYFQSWDSFYRSRQEERWTLTHAQVEARSTSDDPEFAFSAFASSGDSTALIRRLRLQRASSLCVSLRAASNTRALADIFLSWASWVTLKRAAERRELAFNRLVLSFAGPRYSSAEHVWGSLAKSAAQKALQTRACQLLARTQHASAAAHMLRRRYFNTWRKGVRSAHDQSGIGDDWSLVEPLSATFVRPQEIYCRYFHRWLNFSTMISKDTRLREETRTLQREWLTLQNTIDNPASMEELCAEEVDLETSIARTAFCRDAVSTQRKTMQSESTALRMADTLRTLLTGFPGNAMLSDEHANAEALRTGFSSMVTAPPRTSNVSVGGSPGLWRPSSNDHAHNHESHGSALLQKVRAVLCALKGITLHYARDERQLTAAYEFATQLPVMEQAFATTAADLNSSYGSLNSGSNSHNKHVHQRQLSGGTGSWSVTMTSGVAGKPHPASRMNTTSGSPKVRRLSTSSSVRVPGQQAAAPSYANVAEAFDGVMQELHAIMCEAAREAGVDLESSDGFLVLPTPPSTPLDADAPLPRVSNHAVPDVARGSQTAASPFAPQAPPIATPPHNGPPGVKAPLRNSLRWVLFVPASVRRDLMARVLQLVVLFDSYTAHSDTSIEIAGGISTRGASSVRPLPLASLCSEATAQLLVRHATVLFEILQPQLWKRQQQMDSYAKALQLDVVPFAEMQAAHEATLQQQDYVRHSQVSSTGRVTPGAMLDTSSASLDYNHAPPFATTDKESPPFQNHGHPHLQLSSLMSPGSQSEQHRPVRLMGSNNTTHDDDGISSCRLSVRSFSLVSTPRSVTPRGSVSGGHPTLKAYLGFRVYVFRQPGSSRMVIGVKEVASSYINASGEETEGPAALAGLRAGDQLVRFAGYAVTDLAAFNAVVSRHVRGGAELPIVLMREGEMVSTSIIVGMRPSYH